MRSRLALSVPQIDVADPSAVTHLVHFYEEEEGLLDTVSLYLASGLVAHAGCIVVATPAHREGLEKRLSARGLRVEEASGRGQLVLIDASELLAKFMDGALPDRERFFGVVGAIVERIGRGT